MIKRFHSSLFYAADLNATAAFYKSIGFEPVFEDNKVKVRIGDFKLSFVDENKTIIKNESGMQPKGTGVFTYIEVDDVDDHYGHVVANGIRPSHEPKDWPWGKREFVVKDPDGYKIVFFSPSK